MSPTLAKAKDNKHVFKKKKKEQTKAVEDTREAHTIGR